MSAYEPGLDLTSPLVGASTEITIDDLTGDRRRLAKDRRMNSFTRVAAFASIVISALIVVSLIFEAINFFVKLDSFSQLWDLGWFPRRGMYDIKTLLTATLITTAIAVTFAAPLGLGAAIYLSEYAKPGIRAVVKPILEVLAGIPSVVIGFFALTFITPEFVKRVAPGAAQFNLLAAGIGVGILIIPLIASISEDAMQAVPDSLRQAAYGIGARKLAVSTQIIVPAAVSGIVAAFIVAVSRAIGETLVVTIAAGGSGGNIFNADPLQPGLTMTAAMASIAGGTDAVVGEDATFQSLFFVGLLLFLITLGLNILANRFVRRVRQSY